jgi:hypothetical protein
MSLPPGRPKEGDVPLGGTARSAKGAHIGVKIIVIAALVAVVASLFSALYYLYHDKGQGTRMVKALALRVALSIALVVFLLASYHLGWIAPTGLR